MTTEKILTDEQVRNIIEDVAWPNEEVFKFTVEVARAIEQAILQSEQSQATEAYPCRIVETDFETNTVTLEMQGKYTVSSGPKYLCDVPLYRCPVPNSQVNLDSSNHIAGMRKMVVPDGWQLVPIEPTDSMLASARYARQRDQADRSSTIYRAMLAAAPKYKGGSNE